MKSTIPVRAVKPGAGRIRLAVAIVLLALISVSVLFSPNDARAKGTLPQAVSAPQADGIIFLPAIRRPVTAPVIITEFTCDRDNDMVYCNGSVENVSDRIIQDVQVSIYFNGKLETTAYTVLYSILSGQSSSFNASRYYPGYLSGYHAIIASWVEQ